MLEALDEASRAADEGEVPVGAVIIHADRVIGRGHNRTESLRDPTAHAEVIAITAATASLGNWRLTDATVYVTLEPCLMCTGALILARIKRIVFGAHDEKFGACGSVYDIPWDNHFHHQIEVTPAVLARDAQKLLSSFFARRRDHPSE